VLWPLHDECTSTTSLLMAAHCIPFAAEQSSSEGVLLEDVLELVDVPGSSLPSDKSAAANRSSISEGGKGPPVRVVFGCEKSESGEIYRQVADGIMGLGNNDNALTSQVG
jgi:hypothetical protein